MPLTSKLPSLYEVRLSNARTAVKKAEDEKKQQPLLLAAAKSATAAGSTTGKPVYTGRNSQFLIGMPGMFTPPTLPAAAKAAATDSAAAKPAAAASASGSTSGKPVYTGRNSRLLIGMPGTVTPPTLPVAGGQPNALVLLPRASPSAETRAVSANSLTLPTYADAARRNSLQPLANSTRSSGAASPTPARSITVQGANREKPTTTATGIQPLSPLLQPTASPSTKTRSAPALSTALPTYTSSNQLSKIEPLARPLTGEEFLANTPEGYAARQAARDQLQDLQRDNANKYGNRSGGFSSIYEWAPKLWEFIPWDGAFNKTELTEEDIADALGVDRQALAEYNEGAGKSGQLDKFPTTPANVVVDASKVSDGGVASGDVYIFDPENWEDELYANIKRRIDKLSPNLSEDNRTQLIDKIILEEAEKLQKKYLSVYSASDNILASIFSPGYHDNLIPLFTEYPTETTEVNPYFEAISNGLSMGFSAGLWSEALKGIYPNPGTKSYIQDTPDIDSKAANGYNGGAGKSRVLWSGGKNVMEVAANFATKNGLKTLEQTATGKLLTTCQSIANRIFGKEKAYQLLSPLWDKTSARFVSGADGVIHAFLNSQGISDTSVFMRIEYEIAKERGLKVIFHLVK